MNTEDKVKAVIGAALGAAWVLLLYMPPPSPIQAADALACIKYALAALGGYHAAPKSPGDA